MRNILIVVILFLIGCNNEDSVKFNDEIVMKMASEDFNLPSQYGFFYLFAKCKNDKLIQTNINELRVLYKRENSNIKFDEFLREVLNQQRVLNVPNNQDCFVLDSEITEEYYKNNFEIFKSKFFEKTASQKYVLKKGIESEKKNTIFYYCFLNNYLVSFDDYIGYYYLNKF